MICSRRWYFYLALRALHVTQDIIDEPDWGNEEDEEMPTSPTWDELICNDPVNTVSQVFPEEQQNAQVAREPQEYFTESDRTNHFNATDDGSMFTP